MNPNLRNAIIDCLAANHQRATYGAVAQLTGYHPQSVAKDLDVNVTNMFLVMQGNGFPDINLYAELLNQDALVANPTVIEDSDVLEQWLKEHGLDIHA